MGEIHETRAASESKVTRKRCCNLADNIVLISCMTPPFEKSLTVRSVVDRLHAAVVDQCGVPTEKRSGRRYAGGIAAI